MINIKASKREKSTTGYTNKLRLEGFIPAILYGGKNANEKISIAKKDLKNFIQNESFLSTIFEIDLNGKKEKVLPRDVAYHVTTNEPIHLDLMRIVSGTKIVIEIPVKFINNNDSPGLKRGGVLNIVRRKVELRCPADNIPEDITIEMGSESNNYSVKIDFVENLGSEMNVHFCLDDVKFVTKTNNNNFLNDFCKIKFKVNNIHIFDFKSEQVL